MSICDVCNKDLEKESHSLDCPYSGIGDRKGSLRTMMSYGWICPKCDRVHSALTLECLKCNEKIKEDL